MNNATPQWITEAAKEIAEQERFAVSKGRFLYPDEICKIITNRYTEQECDPTGNESKCHVCHDTGIIRNDHNSQGWDDCPHCGGQAAIEAAMSQQKGEAK